MGRPPCCLPPSERRPVYSGWPAVSAGLYWALRIRRRTGTFKERPRSRNQENHMNKFVIGLIRDEQGQDLVEYALIVAAVGLALITTVNQLSTAIVSLYSSITQGLTSIGTSGQ